MKKNTSKTMEIFRFHIMRLYRIVVSAIKTDTPIIRTQQICHEYEPGPTSVPDPTDKNNIPETRIRTKPFPIVLKIIEGALVGYIKYIDFKKFTESPDEPTTTRPPTMAGVAKRLATQEGKLLDEKQYMTHKIICCTFLLKILRYAQDDTTNLYNSM
jgi:hypothetical protein